MYKPVIRRRKYIRRRRIIRRRKVPSTVKRYVKKIIHRNIENKEKILYAANHSVITGDFASMTLPLLPPIVQGTYADNRTGNQVKVTNGVMKCCVNLLPYDASSNPNPQPNWVKVWIVRDLKNTGQLANLDSTAFGKFFRGNGTSLGFQSNPLDVTLDINQDQFRLLYSRVFKLGSASNYSGGFPTTANWSEGNSVMAKYLSIPWGKWCKKQLKFDDNTSPYYPVNENLYFVIQAVTANGTSSAGKTQIEMHYTNTVKYEDA